LSQPPSEHLQPNQIAELYYAAHGGPEPALELSAVHPHLAECSLCRQRFQQCAGFDRQLGALRSTESGIQQAECPDPKVWFDIACGAMEPDRALEQIQHASGCDHCGPLLREAVADLGGALTQPDAELIASLPSARPEWRKKLAQWVTGTLDTSSHASGWQRWVTLPRLATAAAGLIAVAVAGTWTISQNRPETAHKLLAQAFTEQRTLELRIAGASYAPPKVQLGSAGSFLSRPETLLKAETLIADKIGSHPSDPSWLQAKARADLLEGRYDPAVESLRRAVQLAPNSSGLLIDLGTAYFQRGLVANQPADYGAAYEQLSRALAIQPDDPVALFNRAIVAERQFLYRQALEDWEHYLRVDARSDWANEARQRAESVRTRLKGRESKAEPSAPAQVAARASDPSFRAEVDQRNEEYLDLAVKSWLPEAYPEIGAPVDPRANAALFFLAQLTAKQRGDSWLSDILSGASSPNFASAVGALSRAVQASSAEEFDQAQLQADLAYRRFRASGNTAGALRAQFEWAFAAQLNRQSEACRRLATAALTESERHPYLWLHIQLGLESGVCSGLMGNLAADARFSQLAMEQAQQSGYSTLYLRALGFVAGDKFDAGDRSGGWRLIYAGLQRFWSGQFPAMRGYNFYANMAISDEAAGRPNFQLAILQEAVSLIGFNQDMLLRAVAHSATGDAATAAHQPQIAERQYAEAVRLYALAPQTTATRHSRIEVDIRTAQLEARQKKTDAAFDRLTRVQSEVLQVSNDYLKQIFYSILGEVQLGRQRPDEAEQAFRAALALAERSLESMSNEAYRINWSKNAAPVYLGLAEAELLQGREQASLEMFEWYLGSPLRAGTKRATAGDGSETNPSRLPSRLPLLSSQTVLAYGPLPDGLAIWIYDDRGVSAHFIPQRNQDPEDLAARLHDLSSNPRSELNALRRDSRGLYDLLISPVEQHLDPKRTLVIEAEGWVARVPFEVLLDSNHQYLVERGAIVHSQGLYWDELLRGDDRISADSPALIVASTAAPQGAFPPVGVREQAEAVARNFRNARLLLNREVALDAVKEGLRIPVVFNFSGHSLVSSDSPGLMMEDSDPRTGKRRLLGADSLGRLEMSHLQLAVLSACSTADGSAGDSSQFGSIADAFLRSGVPHVVASRWAVDAVETRGFVEDFYRNLLSGISVSEAVRLASRRMLSNPRTAHPYYWSAFAAYGRQ
jgi:CHAT domain-containing protein/tetratricopeptide (TPR) repeat protein